MQSFHFINCFITIKFLLTTVTTMLVGLTGAACVKSNLPKQYLVHKPAVGANGSITRGMGLV